MPGLGRLETAALLRTNGAFQYLIGLPSYPDPPSMRRFLLQAPSAFREALRRFSDWLLAHLIHRLERRPRLTVGLDRTVVTAFQQACGSERWRHLTLSRRRLRLSWPPGESTRPRHRPRLRLVDTPELKIMIKRVLTPVPRQNHLPREREKGDTHRLPQRLPRRCTILGL